jgi:predicted AlkP superfamily phosphohydrolase/phosphomutase
VSRNKLLVIGLDGAPHALIQQWSNAGSLPNIRKVIEQGSSGILRSTMPVHSPTAWATFMTGLNPGKHGVFDFVRRDDTSYHLRLVQGNYIKGTSLWRLLSREGCRVGVMNVPMTYPPEEVNGFLVSGLGTPGYTTYTFPPEMTEALNREGYRVNNASFFEPGKEDAWLADIYETSQRQANTAVRLIKENPWDFFMVVFRNTDEICHFFWHYMDPTHPAYCSEAPQKFKTAIEDFYRFIDGLVGELIAAAGNDVNVVIMSDHGAGPLYKDVFLNEWLWQQGWLTLKPEILKQKNGKRWLQKTGLTRKNISTLLTRLRLQRLERLIKRLLGDSIQMLPRDERPELADAVDWTRTQAYSFGYYGQIFLNLKGREPAGIVAPGNEYLQLRQEIARRLTLLLDPEDGKPVVDKVYVKEELYDGPFLDSAPDLLAIMRDFTYITRKGYEFAPERGLLFCTPYTNETGSHRLEGILIAAGPDIQKNEQLETEEIQALAPTLLHLLQCPVPRTMDGQVIERILTEQYLKSNPIRYSDDEDGQSDNQSENWNPDMEAEIVERLRKLGYLG